MKKFIVFLFVLMTTMPSQANFKLRAREHFEIHQLSVEGQTFDFKGLSNTINAWYEEPYNYAVGLSLSPLLTNIESDQNYSIGNHIALYTIGAEAKYFPKFLLDNLFVRGGLGYSHLRSGGLGKKDGAHLYTGLGYEIAFSGIGLAIEIAYRFVELNDNIFDQVFTPSIGVHFYDMF